MPMYYAIRPIVIFSWEYEIVLELLMECLKICFVGLTVDECTTTLKCRWFYYIIIYKINKIKLKTSYYYNIIGSPAPNPENMKCPTDIGHVKWIHH